mgnify:CR=1 FL=1
MAIAPLLAATTAFIQRAPRMLIGAHWKEAGDGQTMPCLLYTSPSPRDS